MNTALTAPATQTSLASSGILVHVKMTTTTLSVSDQDVSDEITAQKKADSDVGVFIHKLIGKNPKHQAVMSYRATLKNWINDPRNGYEWGGGWSAVPSMTYPRVQQEFDTIHLPEFTRRLEDFLADYPDILANIAFKQGDLFDRSKYPDVNELRRRFSLSMSVMPIPENDWRVKVSEDQAADLHAHYERQHTEMLVEIGRAQREKMTDYLRRIAKACTVEDTVEADGTVKTKRGRLYETTITQALELCDTLAGFNPIGDAQLDEARIELSNLLRGMSIPALKESDTLRSATKQNLDSILSKFGR